MVTLSILEAVLLMCFRPKSHYLIPLIEPRNQGGAYSSTETSPCYDSGAEYISAEMVQPSPAALINRKPSISARHLAFLSPPFLLFVGKFIYRGLPKPQCSKVLQIEGKQCSVGIIQTAQLWDFKSQTHHVIQMGDREESHLSYFNGEEKPDNQSGHHNDKRVMQMEQSGPGLWSQMTDLKSVGYELCNLEHFASPPCVQVLISSGDDFNGIYLIRWRIV